MSDSTLADPPQADAAPPSIDEGKLSGLFQGVDKFDAALPDQARANLTPILEKSFDPNGQRQRVANQLFLATRYKKPLSDVVDNYEAYRDNYAKKAYGAETSDDGSFYASAGKQLKQEGEQRQMMGEMSQALYKHFISGGNPTDFAKQYIPTLQQNPSFDKRNLDVFYQSIHDQTDRYAQFSEAHHDAIGKIHDYLSLASTEQAGDVKKLPDLSKLGPAKEAALSALTSLPEQDQDMVLALGTQGVKSKEEEGVQKFAGRFTRGLADFSKQSADFVREFGGGAASFSEYAGEAPSRLAEKKLHDAFTGKVDPMTANNWAGKAALNTAEGLPKLMAAFTGPGLVANFAAAQNQLQGQYEAKGISSPKAAGMAAVGAGAQTALQFVSARMLTGKIPGLDNWLSSLSTLQRVGAYGALEAGTLSASTAGQIATPDLVQSLASSFDSTLPKVGKDEIWKHLKDAAPEAALQLVPLILVGTGVGSFKSEVFANEYLSDPTRLAAAGHTEATIEKVMEAPTAKEKEAAIEAAHANRELGTVKQMAAVADLNTQSSPLGKIPHNHIPVTIERADGTRYEAVMNGYYDPEKPSIGRLTDSGWSHGLLSEGEKVISPMPTMDQWASGIRDVEKTESRSMAKEAEPEPSITRNEDGTFTVSSADGQPVAHTSTPEIAAKAAADQSAQTPTEKALVDLSDLPDGTKKSALAEYAQSTKNLGIADQASAQVYHWVREAYRTAGEVASFLRSAPKLEGFKKVINDWMGGRQMSAIRMVPFLKEIKRIAPSKATREGIANWIDAGGDMSALQAGYDAAEKGSVKKGYAAALKLKPTEIELAKRLTQWFNEQFERAKASEIMGDDDFRRNYVTQMIERPFVGGGVKSEFYGKLNQNFQYSQERTFPNFRELEGAGFNVQTKDIGEITARYEAALTKAIETRRMVKALMKEKTAQGEPLAYRGEAPEGVESDYSLVDHPTLKGVKFHPEIADHLKNILGRSAITEWYEQPGSPALQLGKGFLKFVDEANRTFANTMLSGISTFHAVHEAKRALGNRINVFNLKEIKAEDPMVEKSVREGLILASPNAALAEFTEGLGGHASLSDKVPGLAQASKFVADFTFNKLIPQIKYTAWLKMRERNLDLLKGEIEGGKITEKDVGYLTSKQVNARFGHLNNADLGKNPTMQHFARMLTLAPDFWESNLRNYGQVLSGLTLSKAGAEPLKAFVFTGLVTYAAARAINAAVNDDHDTHPEEPFGVVHDGRVYTMRSETEDIWRMLKNTRGYISGRLSPTFGSLIEALTGKNWRGEKETAMDAFRDYVAKIVPLSLRWIPGVSDLADKISPTERAKTISVWQQFLGSQGIQVARKSDISSAYSLASDWKKSVGIKEDTGVYPVSKYQSVRYALEDRDLSGVKTQIEKLDPKTAADFKKLAKGAEESLLHPWTGSEKQDEQFFQSLSQRDQLKVLKAQFKRESEVGDFLNALDQYAKEKKIDFHAEQKTPKPSRDPYHSFRKAS